jgi:hypothetical protein
MSKRDHRREEERIEAKVAERLAKLTDADSKTRRVEGALGLAGFACGLASWGWSVVDPASSVIFGSALLLFAAIFIAFAVRRIASLRGIAFAVVLILILAGFSTFDWYIVVKPQRGKPFQALLVEGYHLDTQCGAMPARQQMPEWMRDDSKASTGRTVDQ